MSDAQTKHDSADDQRYRWVFDFHVEGDLRFISHHDTLRLFRRALARAEIPVRFTQGFNPHPRITIPLPRPVGVASDAEALVIETERPIDPDDAVRRLDDHTPAGIRVVAVRPIAPREQPQPDLVLYRLTWDDEKPSDVDQRIRRIMESDEVAVERTIHRNGTKRTVNIRPYIVRIQPCGNEIEFALRVTNLGTVKPAEVAGLLGCDPQTINHRIRRVAVEWNLNTA